MRTQSVKQRGPNRSWREAARGRHGAAMTQGDFTQKMKSPCKVVFIYNFLMEKNI